MKKSIILLLLISSIFCTISTILPSYSGNNLTTTENMLIHIIKKCKLRLNSTIYYTGNNPDLTQALLETVPSSVDLESWILISHTEDDRFGDLTAKSGIIVVFNSFIEYEKIRRLLINYWKCVENCKVIFLSKMLNSCQYAVDTLVYLGSSYYDISYYICASKNKNPIVFTRDKYNNTRRAYWTSMTVDVESLYDGRFYVRPYDKGLCRKFNFKREKPKNEDTRVYVGISINVEKQADMKEEIFEGDILKSRIPSVDHSIAILEELLKIKFAFHIKTFLHKKGEYTRSRGPYYMMSTSVDILGTLNNLILDVKIAYSQPILYTSYVLLSYKSAEATPLQQIAEFYGIWTLISLIILSIITFVVIYLKTNRNATLAAFDVLRLLINSGVEIPINTGSLKIFFCMIFLYFMVIHSTFSGNLPKFLTIPKYYDFIDSLEDLTNPRITTVFDSGYYNDLYQCTNDKIKSKIKYINYHIDLIHQFKMDKNSVCIIEKNYAAYYVATFGKLMNEIYMSKNDIENIAFAVAVRPRFYLRERIQWATTYMFDTGLHRTVKLLFSRAQMIIKKHHSITEIKFRNIKVNDLMFAFIFLIIGNTFGFVCFLIEFVIGNKYHQKISIGFLKKFMIFKRKKTRVKVRKIFVRPRLDLTEID